MRDEVQEVERILPSTIARWSSEKAFRSSFGSLVAAYGSVAMARLIFGEHFILDDDIKLVEYLLLSGADPYSEYICTAGKNKGQTTVPSSEPGAKSISKWLGKTWDELVEWAAEERQKGL